MKSTVAYKIKWVCMLFLTGILFLPLLQQRLQFINVAPLGGFTVCLPNLF
jgi:hypothetical protein